RVPRGARNGERSEPRAGADGLRSRGARGGGSDGVRTEGSRAPRWGPLVLVQGHPSARPGAGARPGRGVRAPRPSLRAGPDAAAGGAGDDASFLLRVQHEGGRGRAGRGAREGGGVLWRLTSSTRKSSSTTTRTRGKSA